MAAAQVPGYRIVHMIGQGGQAKVYLAEREKDGLRVALKVLDRKLRHDRVFFERFLREYQLVAALENEYVARIYDQGVTDDHAYLAMEFLPSRTLASRIRQGLDARAATRVRHCASPRRSRALSMPSTARASCTATSNRPTFCSARMASR